MARISRRLLLLLVFGLLAGILVPPFISLDRFRSTVAERIGGALGRQVTVADVSLRLVPQPGVALRNFVVQEDPRFGAEPMLRAEEVTATLRLSSLWRGRLELGSLRLKYPSLNLVRRDDGRWNLEDLLLRAARTTTAPTANPRPEERPRFPYIEAEDGRINFKSGQAKKVYALNESDFALWLASENEWKMRLQARPVRTDLNLSDTGLLKLNGTFQRAPRLRQMPMLVKVELVRAQLGQLTNLVSGRDRGWRGSVYVDAILAGTPAALNLSGSVTLDDFRRYDILSGESLRLTARCTAKYRMPAQALKDVHCQAPQGDGELVLRGAVSGLLTAPQYQLEIAAKRLPMSAVVRLARYAKHGMPPDLSAGGVLNAELAYHTLGPSAGWSGEGAIQEMALQSKLLASELRLGDIQLAVANPPPEVGRIRGVPVEALSTALPRLMIAPFSVPLGGASPAKASATVGRAEYRLDLRGDAEIGRLLRVADALGLPRPEIQASGSARIDLQIAGNWSGFAPPSTTGRVQLRNLNAQMPAASSPLHLRTGNLLLASGVVRAQNLAGSFTGTHLAFSGSVVFPRSCVPAGSCPVQVNLHAQEVSLEELNRLFNPRLRKRSWLRLGQPVGGESLARGPVEGRIAAEHLIVGRVTARGVVAQMRLADGVLQLSRLRAEIFGGSHHGEWRADFTGPQPVYSLSGSFDRISLKQLAELMADDWASGTASGVYRAMAGGWNADELGRSAHATIDFDWRDGTLNHVSLGPAGGPLHLKRFTGQVLLTDSRLELAASRMDTPEGIYQVTGTASLRRQLDMKLQGKTSGYALSGTVEKPRVAPLPVLEKQAALTQ